MQYEYPDLKTGKTERLCWDDVSGNKVDCRIVRFEKVPFPAGFANTIRRPDFKPIAGHTSSSYGSFLPSGVTKFTFSWAPPYS
jgi:hypothetical protein